MAAVTRFLLRYATVISLFGIFSGLISAVPTIKLFQNLRPDMEELLPNDARSVVDLNKVTDRLESIENLAVLVFTEDSKAGKRFVTDLAKQLEKAPPDVVSSVEYRIDRELEFFRKRQLLYLELADLQRIHDYVMDKIYFETTIRNPLTIFSGVEVPEPKLDLSVIRSKYQSRVSKFAEFPEGFYGTPDGKKRVLLAYAPHSEAGVKTLKAMKAFVEATVRELRPSSYAPDLEVAYTGGVQSRLEEQEALVADLGLSTLIVAVLVGFSLLLYFKNIPATGALLASLFIGTLWTFSISYFTVGYLNANSAFLASIIMGNGINFPIILLASYRSEMRLGRPHEEAVRLAISHTAKSTWTAALAAGLAYGSLTLTGFRGFRQFGIIGFTGMVLCWMSGFVLLPALLTMWHRRRPLIWPERLKIGFGAGAGLKLVERIGRSAIALCVGFLVMTLASLFTFLVIDRDRLIETDLGRLRSKESMKSGAGYLSKYVDEIFQRYLSPTVILPVKREDVAPIAERLRELRVHPRYGKLIASVQTIDDFIPKNQPQKIRLIRNLRQALTPEIKRSLTTKDRALASQLLTPESVERISESDLPPMILSKFTERNGRRGNLIVVEPPITKELRVGQNLLDFVRVLREAADAVAPGTPVAGTLTVSADMIDAIGRDGPRATLFAFTAVVLLVVILFRSMGAVTMILLSLFLGVFWMGGVILGTNTKINFLNFIALPITFGIGVDYGVNMYQRYRQEKGGGRQGILKVVRETGGAVALCSWTTIIGFGSLMIARNQAFVSFGQIAVLGELTCVIAATVALPAFLIFLDRKGKGPYASAAS